MTQYFSLVKKAYFKKWMLVIEFLWCAGSPKRFKMMM